jgi:hypothetical protein
MTRKTQQLFGCLGNSRKNGGTWWSRCRIVGLTIRNGGLYCPPLIPAGIRRNPGNSRNSGGIKFSRGTCQIGKTIPAEFRTEFKFRRNAGITIDGITPERNPRNRPNRASAFADARFGRHQQTYILSPLPPPPSTTPTLCHLLANVTSSPLPHHRHRQRSAASTSIRRPQRAHNERRGNATSPTERAPATTPHYHHATARPHRPRPYRPPLSAT